MEVKGNKMGNIGTTTTIVLIVILFLAGLNAIASDISSNENLDEDSINLLNDITNEYTTNYNASTTFAESKDNLTVNSTFAGVDAFSRQYLEDKSDIAQKKSTIDKILGFPGLFLKMFGVQNQNILIVWSTAIYGFIAIMLSLQAYKAVRTGEVD